MTGFFSKAGSFLSNSGFLSGAGSGLLSFGGNMFSSAINSSRAWGYAREAMRYQDKLNRRFTRDQYGLMREGLTKADYNPLLALGSSPVTPSSAVGIGQSDSDNGTQAVQSAIAYKDLQNNTKVSNSTVGLNNANSALATQQALTEQKKQINYDFQNSMLDVQKHLAQKDLDWYDRKAYLTLYNMFQQAENYRAQSAIGAMNAETNRQNMVNSYKLGQYSNETQRGNRSFSGFGFGTSGYFGNGYKVNVNHSDNSHNSYGGYQMNVKSRGLRK